MSDARVITPADHRSDHKWPVIYVMQHTATPDEVKIGKATDKTIRDRYRSHSAIGDVRIRAILRAPSGATENDLFRHFAAYHIERERYAYEGQLAAWIEWVEDRPFAAKSLETVESAYPAPNMWPWHQEEDLADVDDQPQLFDAGPGRRTSVPESLSDDWQTAPLYAQAVHDVFGRPPDLDPCSTPHYNKTSVWARAIYTIHDDGLRHPWHGKVYMNPPFGGQAGEWVAKLLHEYHSGRVTEAILTLPTRATSNSWYSGLWQHPQCITHHRPFFRHPDGTWGSAPGGHVFVYLGPNEERFLERFREFGATGIMRPPTTDDRSDLRRRAGWEQTA